MRKGKEGFGWMLFRKDGKKFIAYLSSFDYGYFTPVFPNRTTALAWRDKRLEMPSLKIRRMKLDIASKRLSP